MSVPYSLVIARWERADLFGLLCMLFFVFMSLSTWCPGSGVVLDLSIPDLCILSNCFSLKTGCYH